MRTHHDSVFSVDQRASVQDFLDRFARALTSGDTRTIVSMWELPAFVLGDDMSLVVSSPEQVEQFFAGARDQYNSRGITDTRAEILRCDWATERLVLVDVRWPYIDARGHEVGEESSSYALRRGDDGELRMRVALMRGASAPH
jgi:hypothetical protein